VDGIPQQLAELARAGARDAMTQDHFRSEGEHAPSSISADQRSHRKFSFSYGFRRGVLPVVVFIGKLLALRPVFAKNSSYGGDLIAIAGQRRWFCNNWGRSSRTKSLSGTAESVRKALWRCVLRVFTVRVDPASHRGGDFHMTSPCTKLSRRGLSPTLEDADKLLLAPRLEKIP